MSEGDMDPGQVWEAFFGVDNGGAFFRSSLHLLMLIPPAAFDTALERISTEATLGPLLRPSGYVDGRRFQNARDYEAVLRAAGDLRRTLERITQRSIEAAGHEVTHGR